MSKQPYAVPSHWPGETFILLASGPSLTQADVDAVRGKGRVIVINTTYQRAPWADVLYACDAKWWKKYKGAPDFHGLKFALTTDAARWPGVKVLKNTGPAGLELQRHGLRTGRNSGYQAINLAVHLGPPSRIILLGYDMQRTGGKDHWHANDFPGPSPYPQFRKSFDTIVEPLLALGIPVINCTRETALTCFPRQSLESVFPVMATEAVA